VNLSERSTEIKGIFYAHCKGVISVPPSFDIYQGEKHPDNGTIIEDRIKFIDGSLLKFFEKIEDGKIGRYSYEYIRPDQDFSSIMRMKELKTVLENLFIIFMLAY